jgi:hypothetical protein
LKTLDVSGCTALTGLFCVANPRFTTLTVSDGAAPPTTVYIKECTALRPDCVVQAWIDAMAG